MKTIFVGLALGWLSLLGAGEARAGGDRAHKSKASSEAAIQPIDLATALRLAGAKNLDVQIARQGLAEAQANQLIAIEQFFPYLSPGLSYTRHEGNVQTVQGPLIDVNSELYRAGPGATAQINVGDAIFHALAARRLVHAAKYAARAQQQESVFQAAIAYFDLAGAKAASGVALESVRISEDYAAQLNEAVDAGLAFKGDFYRTTTEVNRNRLIADQARERMRLAAARLSQILNLDPVIELTPAGGELAPIHLTSENRSLGALVTEAVSARPELKQYAAQLEAARKNRQGAIYGPIIPTVGGQVFYGGVGGGLGSPGPSGFNESSDYSVGLSWRIGPGGLFDTGRLRANDARVKTGELELEKSRQEITRQVVDEHTRIHSLANQILDVRRGLESAEQALKLARGRQEFAVGEVLENIQAEQDLTRARLDYVTIIAEHNKAQYGLEHARGALAPTQSVAK